MNKRTYLLLGILLVVLGYSVISLFYFEETAGLSDMDAKLSIQDKVPKQIRPAGKQPELSSSFDNSSSNSSQKSTDQVETADIGGRSQNAMPINFTVVGSRKSTSQPYFQPALALIQVDDRLYEYTENDVIHNTLFLISDIDNHFIVVEYEDKSLKVAVRSPNLLADAYKEPEETYSDFLSMSAEEIGSRPRIIEHLATLTSTPYIADGKLLSPGLNPQLFEQAGFQEDDVLKSINGMSVTVEDEFEEVKRQMRYATTLTFEVMRKGKVITLYLDIPSEALKVKP